MSADERLAAVLSGLAERIESEAEQSARAGQYDRLMSIAVEVAKLRDAGYVHRDEVAGAREAVVDALRGTGFWATHADRWNDAEWQAELWSALADAASAAVADHLGGGGR